ncbi:MAG: flagellar hook-associated protein FlgK [Gemmatimonadales bacterium]|nr:MAG: flagellar hook-associated protein FlgK [Gemmatimonadales bacterium]
MSSIGGIFSIAASALRASQAAIAVTGQNVANAGTEGYSRQHLRLEAAPGVRMTEGRFGGGVDVNGVDRSRDILLDAGFRGESSRSEGFRSHGELLHRVESLLGEPGPEGVSAVLDRFFSAWSDLATSPESAAARGTLRQEALGLTERLNDLAAGVDRLRQEGVERLSQQAGRIQALVGDLAAMNRSIVTAESDGMPAPDLRDARDRALDELATLIPIQVRPSADGSVRVTLEGIALVDGPRPPEVGVVLFGGEVRLQVGDARISLSAGQGAVGGTMEAVNRDIPALRTGLDTLAQALVDSVNAIHRTGTNPMGDEGVDFFHLPLDGAGDPLPVSAATLRLSDAVAASALAIAAGPGSDPGTPENAHQAGRNEVALALAGLRDATDAGLGQSLGEHYGELVGGLANRIRQSRDGAAVHRTLAQQADFRRLEVSGVSVDEEMVKLIQFQASYAAAARVLSAADEMLQTLLRV